MSLSPLPDLLLRPLVENALREDLGRSGDLTSNAIIPAGIDWHAGLNARQPGIVAGLDMARLAFEIIDPGISFTPLKKDGDKAMSNETLALVRGQARSLLAAERVALNFLCHLSGIASETYKLVKAAQPHKARICCTRKTTPGLRAVEKYAVRAGGGANHRFGLDDAILIKDNHIAVAGGVTQAVTSARKAVGHMMKIELEIDTLDQLDEALSLLADAPVDVFLLDNMTPSELQQAVAKIAGRAVTEASGRVTAATVPAIAASGVDFISAGWITHSAPILDIGLDKI